MEPIKPIYLQQWEEFVKCTFNRQPIIERIRTNSAEFFKELHASFDQWASLSPRTTEILQGLVPVLRASFEEVELHEGPLDELLVRLINKGNEEQVLFFLNQLEKNKVLKQTLSPIHLQCAYQNQLVRVTLEIIGKKGFLNHCFEDDQTQLHLACKYNMFEVAERLCNLKIDKKERQDALGNTALHYACSVGNIDIILLLLESCNVSEMINCQNTKKQTALHMAVGVGVAGAEKSRIVRSLAGKAYNTDLFILDECDNIPFQHACKLGEIEMSKALYWAMKQNNEAGAKNFLPRALLLACEGGHLQVVSQLVDEYKADVNHNKCSVLKGALLQKKDRVALYLLGRPEINIDIKVKNINLFLKMACEVGVADSVLHAIFEKITLTLEDLYCVCVYKKTHLVAFDMQKIVDDDVDRLVDNTPYHVNNTLFEDLNSQGIKYQHDFQPLLYLAGNQNDVRLAKYLIENKGATVDVQVPNCDTPLFGASANGSLELANMLIRAKANVNAKNQQGDTSLHRACHYDQPSLVKCLLSHGANMEEKSHANRRPLDVSLNRKAFSCAFHLVLKKSPLQNLQTETLAVNFLLYVCKQEKDASDEDKNAVVGAILAAKSTINFSKEENHLWKMLSEVCKDGNYLVLETLLNHIAQSKTGGPDLIKEQCDKADKDGNTLLHFACMGQSVPSVVLLIKCGAEIDKLNNEGKTAVDLMIEFDLRVVLQRLWCAKILEASKINNFECLLSLVCQEGSADIGLPLVQKMNEAGIDFSKPPYKDGRTYLHIACHYGNDDLAKMLLDFKVDITSLDSFGQLPLHLALKNRMWEVAREMISRLKNNPCLNSADAQGRTPLHVACRTGSPLLRITELVSNGANVNALDATGRSPLHEAMDAQIADAVLYLIEHGAVPDIADLQGYTPIALALENGLDWIALQLAEQSNDWNLANIKTRRGYSLFRLACERENWPLAFLLFTKGGTLNHLEPTSLRNEFCCHAYRKGNQTIKERIPIEEIKNFKLESTVLHRALRKSESVLAAHLIAKGEDLNKLDNRNRYPIHIACERGMVTEFDNLLKTMVSTLREGLPEKLAIELVLAAVKGRALNVINWSADLQPALRIHDGFLQLLKECLSIAKSLVKLDNFFYSEVYASRIFSDKGMRASFKEGKGLAINYQCGNTEYLLEYIQTKCRDLLFCDILKDEIGQDQDLFLKLMYARNRTEDLSFFLKDAQILQQLQGKAEVWCDVIAKGHFELVPLVFGMKLLGPSADVRSSLMPCWRSPIIFGKLEMFKHWGIDLMQADENGNGPLHWACQYSHNVAVVAYLLANGHSVKQKNLEGNTPLHIACSRGASPDLVNSLLEAGADLGAQNLAGNTPLHLVCNRSDPVLTKLILERCIKTEQFNLLKLRNVEGEWANLEFLCKEPYAQEILVGELKFLSNALVLIGRSSHFFAASSQSVELDLPSIQFGHIPVQFFGDILLFFHTGKLNIDRKTWLQFFKEIVFFADDDLDAVCKKWFKENHQKLGNIEEAVEFFIQLREWKIELDLLLKLLQ